MPIGTNGLLNLDDLDGENGFSLTGTSNFGYSVSAAGDINGDGIDDFLVSEDYASVGGESLVGRTYVVFGSEDGFPVLMDLTKLDGTNGFSLDGFPLGTQHRTGYSLSGGGDINGDGIGDVVVGAPWADANGRESSGASYVVFGSTAPFDANFSLDALDGSNGFAAIGVDVMDITGKVSFLGDINDDGIDDLIIGALYGDPHGKYNAGESYVVFGSDSGFDATLDLGSLDGTNGFIINGIDSNDVAGVSVSDAGDVNGDGIADILIGARRADPNGIDRGGEAYVIFGSSDGFDPVLELSDLDGDNGFIINGTTYGNYAGHSISSAGDINGDGFDDIIIGTWAANLNGTATGETYVVYGSADGFDAQVELSELDGTNGFTIRGIDDENIDGYMVSEAGDVNGDGIDDVVLTAWTEKHDVNTQTFIIFGNGDGFGAEFSLADINGANGVRIESGNGGSLRSSVSAAGDINNDGFDDILIGEPFPIGYAGTAYVVFGSNEISAAGDDRNDVFVGASGADSLSGEGGNDSLVGNSGRDTLHGGSGSDSLLGGEGIDLLFGDDGDDQLFGGNGADKLNGGAGNDTLDGGAVGDVLMGNDGQDILLGGAGADALAGGNDSDRLMGGTEDDLLEGGEGDDTLVGGTGADVSSGGDGDDQLWAGTGDSEADILIGDAGDDTLGGGAGQDLLVGGGMSEGSKLHLLTASGNASDDGIDMLFGGADDDTLLGGGWDDGAVTDNGSFERGEEVTSGTADNSLWGGGGSDLIIGAAGSDAIGGGLGDDTLDGGAGSDTLYGGKGGGDVGVNDLIDGGAGDDQIFAGGGNDSVIGGDGADNIFSGGGNDTVDGGDGQDTLWGGAGDDVFTGGSGNDIFVFAAGHGDDQVTDFSLTDDELRLTGTTTNFISISDVAAAATEADGGLLIDLGGGDTLFLSGLSVDDISNMTLVL